MRFLLALLLACAASGHAVAVPPPDPARFADELRAFARDDSSGIGPVRPVVFYGSSSIRMWHDRLAADFAPLRVVGRGFGGSTMSEAAHWVDRVVAPLRPWAVVLYEGDNDLEMGRTPNEVLRDFDLLVAKLRVSSPSTHLFVLSIKPSEARWPRWPAMQETNARLAAACARAPERMTYVDVTRPLLRDDGRPRPEMFLPDRLHLAPRAYDAWRTVLGPVLRDAARRQPPAGDRLRALPERASPNP
jgi:lysophospholipase L1-like esterase